MPAREFERKGIERETALGRRTLEDEDLFSRLERGQGARERDSERKRTANAARGMQFAKYPPRRESESRFA